MEEYSVSGSVISLCNVFYNYLLFYRHWERLAFVVFWKLMHWVKVALTSGNSSVSLMFSSFVQLFDKSLPLGNKSFMSLPAWVISRLWVPNRVANLTAIRSFPAGSSSFDEVFFVLRRSMSSWHATSSSNFWTWTNCCENRWHWDRERICDDCCPLLLVAQIIWN